MKFKIALLTTAALLAMYGSVTAQTPAKLKALLIDNANAFRSELLLPKLAPSLDVYAQWAHNLETGTDTYLFRAQYLPLQSGPFSTGGTLEHFDLPDKDSKQQVGLAGKLNLLEEGRGFLGIARYFPLQNEVNGITNLTTSHFFLDVRSSYNFDTDLSFLLLGADCRVTDEINLGVESVLRNGDNAYFGARASYTFD